ncbi:MAG: hypothetical protein E5W94_16230 [Mesorhizobium sp.]|nr:MAG: hypothetical protein E5W94_16230 [Mesorhizobium sp.]
MNGVARSLSKDLIVIELPERQRSLGRGCGIGIFQCRSRCGRGGGGEPGAVGPAGTQEPERENRRVAIRRITPLVAPVANSE